jgi:hypothetical protein
VLANVSLMLANIGAPPIRYGEIGRLKCAIVIKRLLTLANRLASAYGAAGFVRLFIGKFSLCWARFAALLSIFL